jgi:hypothetical protein
MDNTSRVSVLSYCSYKARRVVKRSTAGETLAMADSFDAAFVILHDLETILGRKIPLLLLTDSESLFSTLTRDKYTKERRLLLDIAVVRQAYKMHELSNIGLIDSAHNLAVGLTKLKPKAAPNALLAILQSAKVNHPIKRWVVECDIRSLT